MAGNGGNVGNSGNTARGLHARLTVDMRTDQYADRRILVRSVLRADMYEERPPGGGTHWLSAGEPEAPEPGAPEPEDAHTGGVGVLIAVDFAPGTPHAGQLTAEERRQALTRAAGAAVDALPDGTRFALLGGGARPRVVYPWSGEGWAVAGDEPRRLARFETRGMMPHDAEGESGTSYAAWLALARRKFAEERPAVRHLIMVTDGSSADEPEELERELDACAGRFTCDVLGVGDGWRVGPLSRIAAGLHGAADAVTESGGAGGELAARLAESVRLLVGARLPDLRVEITTRKGVRLLSFAEVSPVRRAFRVPAPALDAPPAPRTHRFTTHLWTAGTREYQIELSASPRGEPLDEEVQLAAFVLGGRRGTADGAAGVAAPVLVRWTDDVAAAGSSRFTLRGQSVLYHARRTDRVRAYMKGCEAALRGEREQAEEELGHACRLAAAADDELLLTLLDRVVHVLDPGDGVVRLRASVAPVELRRSQLRAQRVPPSPGTEGSEGPEGAGAAASPVTACPGCGAARPAPGTRFCVRCGTRLTAAAPRSRTRTRGGERG